MGYSGGYNGPMRTHTITNYDADTDTATCTTCGPHKPKHRRSRGDMICRIYYNTQKSESAKRHRRPRQYIPPHRKYVGTSCAICGYTPPHASLLDVDHIDANHRNNEPANLQTLCANCHRLKTAAEQGWLPA